MTVSKGAIDPTDVSLRNLRNIITEGVDLEK